VAAKYSFVTHWTFDEPVATVWDAIVDSLSWPSWWRGLPGVEEIERGDTQGIGGVRRYTFRSRLPYDLVFDMRTTRVEPHGLLAGEATGELVGTGVWQLREEGGRTVVQYNWDVSTSRPWMNWLAPIARPIFAWNHDVIMRWGEEGCAPTSPRSARAARADRPGAAAARGTLATCGPSRSRCRSPRSSAHPAPPPAATAGSPAAARRSRS